MTESEAEFLRRNIAQLQHRLAVIEADHAPFAAAPPSGLAAPPAPPAGVMAPPPPPSGVMPPPPPTGVMRPPPPPTGLVAPARHPSEFSWPSAETFLKWAGLLLVFLAAVFLVSTAIDRGWIGPEMQLAGSAAIGGALVGIGLVLNRDELDQRRTNWGQPFVAVGLSVLYVCAVAGWWWLELASMGVWLTAAVGVHLLGLWLTQHLDGPGVGAIGVAGATAATLALTEFSPTGAVVTALIILSTMALAGFIRRPALHLWAFLVAVPGFGLLAVDADADTLTLVSGLSVAVAMWFMPLVFELRPAAPSRYVTTWTELVRRIPLSVPVIVAQAIALVRQSDASETGVIYLVVGAVALTLALALYGSTRPERLDSPIWKKTPDPTIWLTQILGGMAAMSIGTALYFDGPALLAALVVQAAALLVLMRTTDDVLVGIQTTIITGAAGLVGLVQMLIALGEDAPLIDDLVHLGLVIVVGAWAYLDRQNRRLLAVTAYLGAMLWAASTFLHLEQGQGWLSAAWALLGLGALLVGSDQKSRLAVHGGLVTLGVVLVKLLTVDLVGVDTFWRAGLFFVLGGTFLAVSYHYGSRLGRLEAGDDGDDEQTPQSDVGGRDATENGLPAGVS